MVVKKRYQTAYTVKRVNRIWEVASTGDLKSHSQLRWLLHRVILDPVEVSRIRIHFPWVHGEL